MHVDHSRSALLGQALGFGVGPMNRRRDVLDCPVCAFSAAMYLSAASRPLSTQILREKDGEFDYTTSFDVNIQSWKLNHNYPFHQLHSRHVSLLGADSQTSSRSPLLVIFSQGRCRNLRKKTRIRLDATAQQAHWGGRRHVANNTTPVHLLRLSGRDPVLRCRGELVML